MDVVDETNLTAVADDAADGVAAIAPLIEGTKGLAVDNLVVLGTQERMLCKSCEDKVDNLTRGMRRNELQARYECVVDTGRYVTLLAGQEEVTATQG